MDKTCLSPSLSKYNYSFECLFLAACHLAQQLSKLASPNPAMVKQRTDTRIAISCFPANSRYFVPKKAGWLSRQPTSKRTSSFIILEFLLEE